MLSDDQQARNRFAVAESNGNIVGIARSGSPVDDDSSWDVQLYVLYLLAAHHGSGAQAFYRKQGFRVDASDRRKGDDRQVKLTLDLHDIYNRGGDLDRALHAIIEEAVATKAPLVEIIPGKGSGALKKRVLRFLERPEIKTLYHRVEKDSKNFGRVFVHFRWK